LVTLLIKEETEEEEQQQKQHISNHLSFLFMAYVFI
jgi:hypothetical protein